MVTVLVNSEQETGLASEEQPQPRQPEVFAYLASVARAIGTTFGSQCEVVVHNLADPEHSIVALEGNLTNRKIGGAITDFGLSVLQSGSPGEDLLSYESRGPDGRRLKSTSLLLRDPEGQIFGAFCINLDLERLAQAAELLAELSRLPTATHGGERIEEHFSDDPVELIAIMLREELGKRGQVVETLKLEDRVEIVRALRSRGAFNFRNAPTIIADLLGVSRFTIYNYLNHLPEADLRAGEGTRVGDGRVRRRRHARDHR